MANKYLQFALSFPLKTLVEKAWCTETMTTLTSLLEFGRDKDPEERSQLARELGALGEVVLSEGWDYCDFQWSMRTASAKTPDWVAEMHIYADESGSPEQVAAFLQQYLEKFDPRGSLWFSWAYTCSKMRTGEFGGGAVVVTATAIEFLDTQNWAEEAAAKLIAASQHP